MKKQLSLGLIILLAGVLLGSFAFGHHGMRTWEYVFITFKGPFNVRYFDELGAEGWEIAAIFKNHTYPDRETVVLKRERYDWWKI